MKENIPRDLKQTVRVPNSEHCPLFICLGIEGDHSVGFEGWYTEKGEIFSSEYQQSQNYRASKVAFNRSPCHKSQIIITKAVWKDSRESDGVSISLKIGSALDTMYGNMRSGQPQFNFSVGFWVDLLIFNIYTSYPYQYIK